MVVTSCFIQTPVRIHQVIFFSFLGTSRVLNQCFNKEVYFLQCLSILTRIYAETEDPKGFSIVLIENHGENEAI